MFTKEDIISEYLKGKSNRYSESSNEDIKKFIESQITLDLNHKEKVYCYINSVTPKCKCCDNIPSFQNFTIGFKNYCSTSCQVKDMKKIQENSRIKNINDSVKDLSVEKIVDMLFRKKLKIQKWRDIEKLSDYKNFRSLEQLYNHIILKENQICEYCEKPFDFKVNARKCMCTTKDDRLSFDAINVPDKDFLNFLIENKLYRNPNKLVERRFYRLFGKKPWCKSFSECVYCELKNITSEPNKQYHNMKIGYVDFNKIIDYSQDHLGILRDFKEKYQNFKRTLDFQYWILHIDGRNTSERISRIYEGTSKYIIPFKCKNVSNDDIFNLLCRRSNVTSVGDKFCCNLCNNVFSQENNRSKGINCKICFPPQFGVSNKEIEVTDFIKTFYNKKIISNDRTFGVEFDIFLPEDEIAFEFNGLYWHSSKFKESKYHLNKTEIAEKNNIQLIHIYENQWDNKKEIVKSIIKAKLGIFDKKIFARKCFVKEVSAKDSNVFLDENHIQGRDNAKYRYGLYHEGELVQLITFKRSHRSKEKYLELKRSCSKLGFNVIGGFSKLLKQSVKVLDEDIVTFADRSYSSKNNVYEKTGFEYICTLPPNYGYVVNGELESREKYQKHKLKNILKMFDERLTEKENMNLNDYFEIYDSGNYKYVYKKKVL